jgi:hypothetical protein
VQQVLLALALLEPQEVQQEVQNFAATRGTVTAKDVTTAPPQVAPDRSAAREARRSARADKRAARKLKREGKEEEDEEEYDLSPQKVTVPEAITTKLPSSSLQRTGGRDFFRKAREQAATKALK